MRQLVGAVLPLALWAGLPAAPEQRRPVYVATAVAFELPPGHAWNAVELEWDRDAPRTTVELVWNGALAGVRVLGGGIGRATISLASAPVRRWNRLELFSPAGAPIRVQLLSAPLKERPATLALAATAWGAAPQLFLDEDLASSKNDWAGWLRRALSPAVAAPLEVVAYDPDGSVRPARPFLVVGRRPARLRSPVTARRDRLILWMPDGMHAPPPDAVVAQVAWWDGQPGIWLDWSPGQPWPQPETLTLSSAGCAVVRGGEILFAATRSQQASARAGAAPPEWWEGVVAWRWLWLGLLWLGISLAAWRAWRAAPNLVWLIALVAPWPLAAGAWTQPGGQGLLIWQIYTYETEQAWDAGGRLAPLAGDGRFDKAELQLWAETGLTDRLTWIAVASFPRARYQDWASRQSSFGAGDMSTGLRWRLSGGESAWVVSLQTLAKFPAYNAARRPRPGNGQADAEWLLLLGRSFPLGSRYAYVSLGGGYRRRWGAPADQLRAEATFGWHAGTRWTLMAQGYGIRGVGAAGGSGDLFNPTVEPRFDLYKLQLSAVYRLTRSLRVQAGWAPDLAGRNIARGQGWLIALWQSF